MNDRISIVPTAGLYEISTKAQMATQRLAGDNISKSMDLSLIKQLMGKLFLPSFLPGSCELKLTRADQDHASYLVFEKADPKGYLTIMETRKAAHLRIPLEACKQITIRDNIGFLIHGAWGRAANELPENTRWYPEICLKLVFEIEEWVVHLNATPATSWTEGELQQIAESLQTY